MSDTLRYSQVRLLTLLCLSCGAQAGECLRGDRVETRRMTPVQRTDLLFQRVCDQIVRVGDRIVVEKEDTIAAERLDAAQVFHHVVDRARGIRALVVGLIGAILGVGLLALGKLDRTPWRDLHEELTSPLRAALPQDGSRLTIVPHGPLFRLSFAALQEESGRYLIERYDISYAPSAAMLATEGGHASERGGPWLLVGSYHVSQQNTFTGRLTEPMLDRVFARANFQ